MRRREDGAAWRHGRGLCGDFFPWYNTEHHHVGLGLFTPHDIYYGLAKAKREQRACVLAAAFACHPERFTSGGGAAEGGAERRVDQPGTHPMSAVLEKTMTRESRPAAIVDPDRSLEAVPRVDPSSPSIFTEARSCPPST